LRIDQGVAMDRPGLLDATARKEHGKVTEISVCGRATIIGHGIITIPGQEPADARRSCRHLVRAQGVGPLVDTARHGEIQGPGSD
jgi:hypothetical protein